MPKEKVTIGDIARRMAAKDGAVWDGLDQVMKSAYIHNAREDAKNRYPNDVLEEGEIAVGEVPALKECQACNGRGFTELEHGLVQVECSECEGRGKIDDNSDSRTEPNDKPIENGDDLRSSNGDDLSHPTTGSPDTSQPKQPKKSKTKKKARKRSS